MNKRERLMAAVKHEEVDRIPVGFWYHFDLEFPSGKDLADAELDFVKKYDPDFIKVMHDLKLDLPNGMTSIERTEDWKKLVPLDPTLGGFAEQIKTLRYLRSELKEDMIIIDTIFNPYATANKLCGKKLIEHINEDPESVRAGLRAITISLTEYAQAWIKASGDGIFYALDGVQKWNMDNEEYAKIFSALDFMILDAAMREGVFNVLHLHGTEIPFDILSNLPCHVINWSDKTTYPSLSEARKITNKCIAGGINETNIGSKSADEVTAEAKSAIEEAGAKGFILTPGCAVPTDVPEENLHAIRRAVNP
jgi:uroporphyrinogen decarboxylase